MAVWATFSLVAQLIVVIIYDWGECLSPDMNASTCNLNPGPDFSELGCCRDAERRHGVLGWAAEVSCDILLVVMVEIFFPVSQMIARWIADLRNHQFASDRQCLINVISLALATFESVAFRLIMAIWVAPQWVPPSADDSDVDCGFLDTWCDMQFRLDVARRRWVFEKLLKGPFCVAPFVSIIIKVVVPMVVMALHSWAGDGRHQASAASIAAAPLRAVVRLLGLLFVHDVAAVGCLRFLKSGWPFGEPRLILDGSPSAERSEQTSNASPPRRDHLPPSSDQGALRSMAGGQSIAGALQQFSRKPLEGVLDESKRSSAMARAMQQFARKPFDVEGELMETKLSFLGVLFFAPVMPLGVGFTLLARALESGTDLAKLLRVQRRTVPVDDEATRRIQSGFMFGALLSAAGWHVALNVITYNDSFWELEGWRFVAVVAIVVWLKVKGLLIIIYNEGHRSRLGRVARAIAKQADAVIDASRKASLNAKDAGVDAARALSDGVRDKAADMASSVADARERLSIVPSATTVEARVRLPGSSPAADIHEK